MLVQRELRRSLIAIVLVLGIAEIATAKQIESCDNAIPRLLRQEIERNFPGREIVTLAMLEIEAANFYRKASKQRCPGVTKVDFYGDGNETYGLILSKKSDPSYKSSVIMATKRNGTSWQFAVIEADVEDAPPVVLTKPPGEYVNVYGDKQLKVGYQAIIVIGYESWAVLYSWNGKEVEKIWMAD